MGLNQAFRNNLDLYANVVKVGHLFPPPPKNKNKNKTFEKEILFFHRLDLFLA